MEAEQARLAEQRRLEEEARLVAEQQRLEQERVNAAAQALQQLGFQHWPTAPPNLNLQYSGISIGSLQEFQEGQNWLIYKERLEQYFIANRIDEARKAATLLTLIGEPVYKTLRDLCDPILPSQKSFPDLYEILKKQYSPKISVFKERKDL